MTIAAGRAGTTAVGRAPAAVAFNDTGLGDLIGESLLVKTP